MAASQPNFSSLRCFLLLELESAVQYYGFIRWLHVTASLQQQQVDILPCFTSLHVNMHVIKAHATVNWCFLVLEFVGFLEAALTPQSWYWHRRVFLVASQFNGSSAEPALVVTPQSHSAWSQLEQQPRTTGTDPADLWLKEVIHWIVEVCESLRGLGRPQSQIRMTWIPAQGWLLTSEVCRKYNPFTFYAFIHHFLYILCITTYTKFLQTQCGYQTHADKSGTMSIDSPIESKVIPEWYVTPTYNRKSHL